MATAAATTKPGMPFSESGIAKYLTKQIELIQGEKSQRQIAAEIGYDKPNMISMFKRGEARVPLQKVPALARSLRVDPAHLLRLALEQYDPEFYVEIGKILDRKDLVTENEVAIIHEIRKVTKNMDLSLTSDLKKRLHAAFKG